MTENGHKSLAEAVRAVQAEVGIVPFDATNPHYSSRYASLKQVVETVRPLLVKHGLVWQTFPTRNSADHPSLRYRLTHVTSGERDEDMVPLMLERATPQGLGSGTTYMRRYALVCVLDLVADEDDDAELAQPKRKPKAKPQRPYGQPPPGADPAQRRQIQALIKETGISKDELAAILGGLGVLLGEGWMDKLEPGADGTAVTLIDLLDRRNRGMEV